MRRGGILCIWVAIALGCSDGGSEGSNGPLLESDHSHYHVHASDVVHDHRHKEFQAGGHQHRHQHD